MSLAPLVLVVLVLGVGLMIGLALREHGRMRRRRRGLLDACAPMLSDVALRHGGDDFPMLTGRVNGRALDVRLVSDAMTIRRLPQLWLQVTALEPLDIGSGLAALVRPNGSEFYSLTSQFEHTLAAPAAFPPEIIVRGESAQAAHLLDRLAGAMAAILADPAIKEIAVTRKGLRIVRQAGEGRRGEYLLLRQAVFDAADVPAADLARILEEIETLSCAVRSAVRVVA